MKQHSYLVHNSVWADLPSGILFISYNIDADLQE